MGWRRCRLAPRYEGVDAHQVVTQAVFEKWLSEAQQQPGVFALGHSLLHVLSSDVDETAGRWFRVLDELADVAGKSCMRVAETLNTAQIAQVLCQHDLMPSHLKDEDIATLPYEEWPTSLSEIAVFRLFR